MAAININNTSLLAYYPLDTDLKDYSTGAAVLSATTIANVSVSSSTTKLYSGSAFFPGVTGQQITLPPIAFNASGITVSAWIKANSVPFANGATWFDFGAGLYHTNFAWLFNNASNKMEYFSYYPSVGSAWYLQTTYTVSDTNWHHYCFVVTPSNQATLYVDSSAVYTFTGYPGVSETLTSPTIGNNFFSGNYTFSGYMNQFIVMNRAITATELNYLYRYPAAISFSSAATSSALPALTYNVSSTNLLYTFPFDTNFLNYASSPSGNVAFTASGGMTISNTYTKLSTGSALFNGSSTYLRFPSFTWSASGGITFSLWNRATAGTLDGCIYDFAGDTSATGSTALYVSSGNLAIRVNNASVGTSTAGTRTNYVYPIDGSWHHICHTIQPTGVHNVYVDGVSIGNTTVNAYPSITTSLGNAFIGKSSNGSFASWPGTGKSAYMNQFTVYNRVLNALEISYIYNNTSTVTFSGSSSASSTAFYISPANITFRNAAPVSVYFITGDTFSGNTYTLKTADNVILGNFTASSNQGTLFYKFDGSTFGPGISSLTVYDPSNNPVGAPVPLNIACFREGTKICVWNPVSREESYKEIEFLRKGDWVKTSCSGYQRIHCIGRRQVFNAGPQTNLDNSIRVFRTSLKANREDGLFEDLYITGNHCVLRPVLSKELQDKILQDMGDVFITEQSYRVPAHLDDHSEKWDYSGLVTVWHFALENTQRLWNYGVYANGLLVESSSIRYMEEFGEMEMM